MSGILAEVGLTLMWTGAIVYLTGLLLPDLTEEDRAVKPWANPADYLESPQIIVIPIPEAKQALEERTRRALKEFEGIKQRVQFKLDKNEYTEFKRKLLEGQRRRVEAHQKLDASLDAEEKTLRVEQHPAIKKDKEEGTGYFCYCKHQNCEHKAALTEHPSLITETNVVIDLTKEDSFP